MHNRGLTRSQLIRRNRPFSGRSLAWLALICWALAWLFTHFL